MGGRACSDGRPARRLEATAALLFALLPLSAAFAPAHAQILRGSVVRADRTPIPDVQVVLRSASDSVVARATSGAQGRFVLRPLSGGVMRLEASTLGYADWETAMFELTDDADLEVVITLQFSPIPLEELRVEARRRQTTRRLADFERRRQIKAFGGYFMDEEDIARRPAARPSNLPLQFPGMSVAGGRGAFDLYTIMAGDCVATVYVDGVLVDQRVTSVDEYLQLPRIAGVEVYPRGVSAPVQYQDPMSNCGTVLFWTKELEPDDPGGWNTTKIVLGTASLAGLLILAVVR